MKMKCITMLLLCLALVFSSGPAKGETADDARRLAGWYVSFDEGGQAVLNRGIIGIQNGMISDIQPYREGEADVIYPDEDCVIFPGLIDLHSHMTYNYIQLTEFHENTAAPWDNRFEWQETGEYQTRIEDKEDAITGMWQEPYNIPNVLYGDLIDYFLEFQAAAGGTTLIQVNPDKKGVYDLEDFHQNVRLIRATGDAQDLGTDRPVMGLTKVFTPDPALSPEDPLTYLPRRIHPAGELPMFRTGTLRSLQSRFFWTTSEIIQERGTLSTCRKAGQEIFRTVQMPSAVWNLKR